MIILKDRIY